MNLFQVVSMLVILLCFGVSAGEVDPKAYESTTLANTFNIEWACFTGVIEHLDGPAREAMGRQMGGSSTQGCLRGMQSDDAGNLYLCDMTGGILRAVRKRDGMMLTISGNGHINAGRLVEKEGPAYRLGLDQMVYIAAVGDPLEGKDSLYLATGGYVLRLYRNEAQENRWWFEQLAGGGDKPITGPDEVGAFDVSLREARLLATPEGKIGVIRVVGGGESKRSIMFWLQDGKLIPAYDEAAIQKTVGQPFSCYGIDGVGNIVGSCGNNCVVAVAPDGKTIKHQVKLPFWIGWGVYPDRKREVWFVKGMDHYTITKVTPDGKSETLKMDGTWETHKEGMGSRGYNIAEGVQWMWCLPLQDGRMIGWNSHGCYPLFVGTWLEKGANP